ncbi:PREDICTED: uncharacterized protein LOC104800884 [Tarenaya hassleriana]|uniref:uncharacterized protein LOC104800884 n=1 Tax=Tarenaya hassleriana TaxID=28532 RepID=UPI00053C532D|nr:PREDICTED: uncharacterized protein LOC104800884 [Tarenaya hassleriana]
MKRQVVIMVLVLVAILVVSSLDVKRVEGARPVRAENEIRFVFQSLQRGPVDPPGNGCPHIPRGSGRCHG